MSVRLSSMPITFRGQRRNFRFLAANRRGVTSTLKGKAYPRIPFLRRVTTIVDVGASVGSAALFFSQAYPEAVVYCFEPHEESFDLLRQNTQGLNQIQAFNFGLFDETTDAELHIGNQTFTTNSIHRAVDKVEKTETIQLREAASTLRDQGIAQIDILKVDTEGCEVQILGSLLPHFRPTVIHLEYHNDNDRRALDDMLCDDMLLYAGRVWRPHLGEATYVRHDAFPSTEDRDRSSRGLY